MRKCICRRLVALAQMLLTMLLTQYEDRVHPGTQEIIVVEVVSLLPQYSLIVTGCHGGTKFSEGPKWGFWVISIW